MKTLLSICIILFSTTFSLAQKDLVNKYNYYSEVHGGMEDRGVSRIESFVFVATTTIEIKEIFYEGQAIYLKKGDSIVVHVNKYIPYKNNPLPIMLDSNQTITKAPEIEMEDRYKVLKVSRIYCVNVQYPYVWPGTLTYVCKKNLFVAKIKEGFDKENTGYAP